MKSSMTYLFFNGNCKEAMTFYGRCFGAEVKMMPIENSDRVMHASITTGRTQLMASDSMENLNVTTGTNFSVYLECESREQVDNFMRELSVGGKVTMAADNTFWGSYFGSVTDRYQVQWMLGYDLPAKSS